MRLNQLGQSKLDTVLKVMLIAFVSLLAFSSGVFFGKKMSDIEQTHQASNRSHDAARSVASADDHGSAHRGSEAKIEEDVLTEDEVNALEKAANSQAAQPKHTAAVTEIADTHAPAPAHEAASAHHDAPAPPAAAAKSAAAPAAAPAPSKPDLSTAHQVARRIANDTAPEVKAPARAPVVQDQGTVQRSRVPSSLPRTVGAAEVSFTLQVAAYPTLAQAQEHADRLVKQGFPAFPVAAQVAGKTWHRVSVGSFATARDAAAFRTSFMKQTNVSQALVQRIQR